MVRPPRGAAKGLTKMFPVGKLLRPAGGLRKGAQVAGRKTAVKGINQPSKMVRKLNQRQAWKRASEARDDLHRQLARDVAEGRRLPRGQKTVITGATDPSTGMSAGGHNFAADGGWGCAEKNALDNLNAMRRRDGLPPLEAHQVDFTKATNVTDRAGNMVDPPGFEKPICSRWCQDETYPEQFPDDVRYETGGTWDDMTTHGRRR